MRERQTFWHYSLHHLGLSCGVFGYTLFCIRLTVTKRLPMTSASNPIKQLHNWEYIDQPSQSCYSVVIGLQGFWWVDFTPELYVDYLHTQYCICFVGDVLPCPYIPATYDHRQSYLVHCLSSSPCTHSTVDVGMPTLSLLVITRE